MTRKADDHLGSLAEVAVLLNAGRIKEAHDILAKIEADEGHEAWKKPITISVLRDRIRKATP